MAYAFDMKRRTDNTNASRSISSVASQVIDCGSTPANTEKGRVVEVLDSATNNSCYTCLDVPGAGLIRVAESINNSGASGRVVCGQNATYLSPDRIVSGTITSFPGTDIIEVSGLDPAASGIVLGDFLAVLDDPNEGGYFVKAVLGDRIQVVDNQTLSGNCLTASGASSGYVRVSAGYGKLTITDEATVNIITLAAAYPYLFLNQDRPVFNAYAFDVPTLRQVEVAQTGATSTVVSGTDLVLKAIRKPGEGTGIDWSFTGGSAGVSTVQFGISGTEPYSNSNGSVVLGGFYAPQSQFNTLGKTHAFGTLFHGGRQYGGPDSIYRGVGYLGGTLGVFTGSEMAGVVTGAPSFALAVFGSDVSMSDVYVIEDGSTSALIGTVANISDFRLGDDLFRPVWGLLNAHLVFRNPKQDYTTTELGVMYTASSITVDYVWEPTFKTRDLVGNTGQPISGLKVHVYEINQDTGAEAEISGSPFTTNGDGQIDTAVYLRTRYQYFGQAAVEYSHRIRTSGRGLRSMNQPIKMATPFRGDIAIDFLQTDFEGEVST